MRNSRTGIRPGFVEKTMGWNRGNTGAEIQNRRVRWWEESRFRAQEEAVRSL